MTRRVRNHPLELIVGIPVLVLFVAPVVFLVVNLALFGLALLPFLIEAHWPVFLGLGVAGGFGLWLDGPSRSISRLVALVAAVLAVIAAIGFLSLLFVVHLWT